MTAHLHRGTFNGKRRIILHTRRRVWVWIAGRHGWRVDRLATGVLVESTLGHFQTTARSGGSCLRGWRPLASTERATS